MVGALKVLTVTPKFVQHQAPDLSSAFYDEYVALSRHVKLYVMSEVISPRLEKGITAIKLPSTSIPKLRAILSFASTMLIGALLTAKVNLVYVRQFSPQNLALIPLAKALRRKAVLCLGGTGLFPAPQSRRALDKLKHKAFRLLLKLALATADAVVLYSKSMVKRVEDESNVVLDAGKLYFVRNPVDTGRFKPGEESALKSKLGIDRDEKVVLYVGRVNEKKGVGDLFSAFSRLKERAALLVVGKCEEAYKRKLLKLVEGRKAIFTGEVPNSELPSYYNVCDVFLMPSRKYEGIPRVVLEAMAAGKPVIASDVGGVKDVIKEGQTGLLFKPGDAEELYSKLLNLLRDDEMRKAIGKAAREFVVAEHSVNHVAAKLADLMIKVAKS